MEWTGPVISTFSIKRSAIELHSHNCIDICIRIRILLTFQRHKSFELALSHLQYFAVAMPFALYNGYSMSSSHSASTQLISYAMHLKDLNCDWYWRMAVPGMSMHQQWGLSAIIYAIKFNWCQWGFSAAVKPTSWLQCNFDRNFIAFQSIFPKWKPSEAKRNDT